LHPTLRAIGEKVLYEKEDDLGKTLLKSRFASFLLHVVLSNQIKSGHASAWMRVRVCASFMLRPSLLPFGFAPWFARILRETFAEKPNDAPSSLSVIKKEASALAGGDTLGNHR
jgi:hypothetical protein